MGKSVEWERLLTFGIHISLAFVQMVYPKTNKGNQNVILHVCLHQRNLEIKLLHASMAFMTVRMHPKHPRSIPLLLSARSPIQLFTAFILPYPRRGVIVQYQMHKQAM
jgi:hypothetical protein